MVRPGDVVVLIALLVDERADWTLRSLAERLGVAHAKVQRALDRLATAGLYDAERRRARPRAAEEFLLHAVKYLHPVVEGASTRGVPTAWGAAPLADEIVSDGPVPVWPSARGRVRGPAIVPLDPVLPVLAERWPEVTQLAALTDALRVGDARAREAAARHIRDRLKARA